MSANSPDDRDPLTEAKNAICQKVGYSIGGALVSMLREHSPCACVSCQYQAIAHLCDWTANGEDVRHSLPAVLALITALESLRDELGAVQAFGEALAAAGVSPNTDFGTA